MGEIPCHEDTPQSAASRRLVLGVLALPAVAFGSAVGTPTSSCRRSSPITWLPSPTPPCRSGAGPNRVRKSRSRSRATRSPPRPAPTANGSVKLDKLTPTSTPQTLTVKGKNTLTVKDVLVGEVWLASGQSNMAFPVSRGLNAEQEKAAANFPQLRMFTVRSAPSARPRPIARERGRFARPIRSAVIPPWPTSSAASSTRSSACRWA